MFVLFQLPPDECDETGRPVATADGAQVGIGSQQVVQNQAVPLPVYAVTALDMVSEAGVRRKILQTGIVEFVRLDLLAPGAFGARPRMCFIFLEMHITASDGLVMHLHIAGNRADHLVGASLIFDAARQIHQPAAFGIGRHAVLDGLLDLAAQCTVGLQFGGTGLGKTAADV